MHSIKVSRHALARCAYVRKQHKDHKARWILSLLEVLDTQELLELNVYKSN